MTKSQVDKLGERLKAGNYTDDDLRLLDEYRQSFIAVGEYVIGILRSRLNLEPTGRPAKTTASIIAKLRRQSIRLGRIQDIGGCRIIVDNIASQNAIIEHLRFAFGEMSVIDRRQKPSHGYRAVHVIVKYDSKLFEIQIRTIVQHLWAEFSERISDAVDARIKYGEGPASWLQRLAEISELASQIESLETDERVQILDLSAELERGKIRLIELLKNAMKTNDFSY